MKAMKVSFKNWNKQIHLLIIAKYIMELGSSHTI